jgi:glycosyltransferase involved in cell wall biosynthesis
VDRKPILLAWRAANDFGWGIVGLSLFLQWARSQDVAPLMALPIRDANLSDEEPSALRQIFAAIMNSNTFADQVGGVDGPVQVRMPVVHALGNRFAGRKPITGQRNLGRIVFEDTDIRSSIGQAAGYDVLVCASRWNAELIRSQSSAEVHVIHEAVDHALFRPGPKTGLVSPDRFYVFSGGKVEFRKAQDLVLAAFREFSRHHDDAVLVTAWHSPWDEVLAGFQGVLEAPIALDGAGRLNVLKWAADNGVAPGKVIDLGRMPNQMVPALLREMDCALQPSRAEGATNLVAMEAMACGLPVILADNTGMADLIEEDACLPLQRQSAVDHPQGLGTSGWGESDVEEIVAALEQLYTSGELRREIGAKGAALMRSRTWAGHAQALQALAFGGL